MAKALQNSKISILQIETPQQIDDARALIRAFFDYALSIDKDASAAATFQGLDDELNALPGDYGPPDGCLLVAYLDGLPAGCVGFRRHDDETAEVKRMFVSPEFRGHGTGVLLVSQLIETARRMNYRRIILGTHPSLKAAQKIYRSIGFVDVSTPINWPKHHPKEVLMEMSLT
ncbi:GNAT family N-acetyltransferase [Pararhizobium sp. IMCC21322]|uniref:GNAT family N-acetyltransferase n=1 Tax=Pararhizobium sp. IMCC21322 TaxID=3067903 RepID=UPI002741AE89|nr:GNAT family N-acetyltransferase [Pararhizobium sp. IMCC21322]